MPSKNIVKEYIENGYYHIYNRGVEKRNIFIDEQDYSVFLSYLQRSLIKNDDKNKKINRNGYTPKEISEDIDLVAYCLMPNHFHLLVRQNNERAITSLMKCIATSYSMYFNKKYHRVGGLFQGRYKAILIKSDQYLSYLSAYIHLNPVSIKQDPINYNYSSCDYYLKGKKAEWLKIDDILDYFNGDVSKYKKFLEENNNNLGGILGDLTLEDAQGPSLCKAV
jgi:putative transposase